MEINQKERYSRHYEDIKRCIEYMNENYSKKITLSDLAELAHMSPNYFCSYFKECTGVSTFNQLNHIRIKKAIAFLSEGDDLIADIAINCGFENMSFFIKKFKEVTGCTPSAYRKGIK